MQDISTEARKRIAENTFVSLRAQITFRNGTRIDLSDEDFMMGTAEFEQSVSPQDGFAIGSAIVGKCSFSINNYGDKFSMYDFAGASVSVQVGIPLDEVEWVQMGVYDVSQPDSYGDIIHLDCYDVLARLERSFDSVEVTYPATVGTIVSAVCSYCGVPLASSTFSGSAYKIKTKPLTDGMSCLNVISYMAQVSGHFCHATRGGKLELGWYDTGGGGDLDGGDFIKYTSGSVADGGDFIDYSSGDSYDGGAFGDQRYEILSGHSSLTLATDDVTVTGVTVTASDSQDVYNSDGTVKTAGKTGETSTYGKTGYTVAVTGNPFIENGRAAEVAKNCKSVVGMRFRVFHSSTLGRPYLDAGDTVYVVDRKGDVHKSVLTTYRYKVGGYASCSCDAVMPKFRPVNETSEAKKVPRRAPSAETVSQDNLVEDTVISTSASEQAKRMQRAIKAEREARSRLADAVSGMSGLYETTDTKDDGSTVYYMHDKRELADSSVVWRLTADALSMSTDGGATYPYSLSVDGEAILDRLAVTGIDAERVKIKNLLSIGGDGDGRIAISDSGIGMYNSDSVEMANFNGQSIGLGIANKDATVSLANGIASLYAHRGSGLASDQTYLQIKSKDGVSVIADGSSGNQYVTVGWEMDVGYGIHLYGENISFQSGTNSVKLTMDELIAHLKSIQ